MPALYSSNIRTLVTATGPVLSHYYLNHRMKGEFTRFTRNLFAVTEKPTSASASLNQTHCVFKGGLFCCKHNFLFFAHLSESTEISLSSHGSLS